MVEAITRCNLMLRVERVLKDLAAARELSDEEILQHARDCAALMEAACQRFEAWGTVADREESYLWMHRRDEAMRALSPAYKAAREAEIHSRIGASA